MELGLVKSLNKATDDIKTGYAICKLLELKIKINYDSTGEDVFKIIDQMIKELDVKV